MHLIIGPAPGYTASPSGRSASSLPHDVAAVYPMTRSQEGLWRAYSAAPKHTMFNLTLQVLFRGADAISLEQLLRGETSVHTLTARHAMLRSTFHKECASHPKPYIMEWNPSRALPVVRLLTSPSTPIDQAMIHSCLRTAVDLSSEFAVRWVIVQEGSNIDLYLVAHHIALDGKSMSVLSSELLEILSISESQSKSPVVSDTFHKMHIMETAYRSSSAFEAAEEFWLGQSKISSPLVWKTKSPPLRSTNYREIDTWFNFSKEELARLSERYRTSWFRVAVSIVGVLLQMSSEPTLHDNTVALAFSGRPDRMAQTVGHFTNALPIKIPLNEVLRSQNPTLDALVRSVAASVSAAKKHDQFSFLDLCDAHRAAGLTAPRLQVAITLSPQLACRDCRLYPVEGSYDLFFCFLEGKDTVSLDVIYDPLVFSAETVNGFKAEFGKLTELARADTLLDLTSFPSLMAHIPRLLPSLDPTDSFQISTTPLQALFAYQVARNPAAAALYCGEKPASGQYVTYLELHERSNQIAHVLRQSGVRRHKVVLLYLERSFALMEWIIGVLKSGAAYTVADQGHPIERTRSVISVAQPDLIVDDGNGCDMARLGHSESVPVLDTRILRLKNIFGDIENISEPSDVAYIMFTSGSTGQPKGVDVLHSNLSHFVVNAYASGYLPLGSGSRVLQWANFTFDASVIEWSLCLAFGGTLCFTEFPHALVGDYLADVIESNNITHINLTASMLATLPVDRLLPTLVHISVGGEMVPDGLVETWLKRVNVQNAYGPTECTAVMAHQSYARGAHNTQPTAIIGKPFPHMAFYTCEEQFQTLLPANEIGELCIGGPQVGRGYRNRHDLTDKKFMVHPQLGQRLYRTGDRGKILPDGRVFILGRLDREIKIRGYRINLADVERFISELITEVVSVSVQAVESGMKLCAFVTPSNIDGEELRRRLEARIPRYMVPQAVFGVQRLPLNANGKTDHQKVQQTIDDLISSSKQASPFTPPITPPSTISTPSSTSRSEPSASVKLISEAWIALLDLKAEPRAHDNFFELGGNSILAQSLTTRLRKMFPSTSRQVSVIDIFTHPRLQELTSLMDNLNNLAGPTGLSDSPINTQAAPVITPNANIAIVGIAGRFPGASNADDFYDLLLDRKEALSFFPRKPTGGNLFEGEKYVPKRGTLLNMHEFDGMRWGISEDEARTMDPQQQLFVMVAKEALEDADCVVPWEGPNITGLYVGAATRSSDSGHPHEAAPCISAQTAYHLNLQGPSVTLDTACSSGMVALSLAVDHLRAGRCDIAVVGGVSTKFPQTGYVAKEHGILSPSGHCRPFDHRADGSVPGDAVCALVLRRLDDAIAAANEIYAVVAGIAGAASGSMGKAGLTTPSPRGQAETIKRAWADAGMSPTELVYAELHGSGTPIGDALELEGMRMARAEVDAGETSYTFGSNKGNVGNCEAASGIISVIKLCKSIQHRFIPPLQSFEALNPMIQPNPVAKPAAEGVHITPDAVLSSSSLGFGGINVHCIIRFPPAAYGRISRTRVSHAPEKHS
ncbi:amino acid adenylation domain protein [Mycena pura]|uniref:Amino acid adenylation domain protein n=1 Tax=Mycena pura TaxID=153505 RepID=A0AAD6VC75_9AGAR|nr:amino acid adenylation domain protein [Mycena pura]